MAVQGNRRGGGGEGDLRGWRRRVEDGHNWKIRTNSLSLGWVNNVVASDGV